MRRVITNNVNINLEVDALTSFWLDTITEDEICQYGWVHRCWVHRLFRFRVQFQEAITVQ